jgi:acetyl esterase/lipase
MTSRLLIFALAAAVVVGACTSPSGAPLSPSSETPRPTAPSVTEAAEPGSASASTPVSMPFDGPTDVEIPAADGLILRGAFVPGQDPDGSAVLLLHMYGSDRSSWGPFAMALASSGISSLALDLRGHGATGGAEDWGAARQDTAAAIAWLRSLDGLDPERIGIAGASIGANLALVQAADDPGSVAAVAALSPGLDYFRVVIDGRATEIGDLPLFLAASEEDGYSAETVRTLAAEAHGAPTLAIFQGSAHGTDMLSASPELAEMLFEFLRGALER